MVDSSLNTFQDEYAEQRKEGKLDSSFDYVHLVTRQDATGRPTSCLESSNANLHMHEVAEVSLFKRCIITGL